MQFCLINSISRKVTPTLIIVFNVTRFCVNILGKAIFAYKHYPINLIVGYNIGMICLLRLHKVIINVSFVVKIYEVVNSFDTTFNMYDVSRSGF